MTTSASTSTDTVGSTLFKAIPPSLDSKEYDTILSNLKSLNITTDSIVTEYNKNTCRTPNTATTKTATTTTTNSQIQFIQTKLDKYQNDLYTVKNITSRNTIEILPPTTSEDGKVQQLTIEIRTYAETIDTNNCMSASWYGVWNTIIVNETTCTVNGTITIHIHYYERGSNIQTRYIQKYCNRIVSTKEEKVNSIVAKFEKQKMSYEEQLSNSIIKEILNLESIVYNKLQELYTTTVTINLKQLRRILPITKTRFKWDTAAQKQVQLLNEKKNNHSHTNSHSQKS